MPTRSRYQPCRTCKRTLLWAETTRGKRIPIDIAPGVEHNGRTRDGNVRLIHRTLYDEPLAIVLSPRELARARAEHPHFYEQGITDEPELLLYTCHLNTSPDCTPRRARVAA